MVSGLRISLRYKLNASDFYWVFLWACVVTLYFAHICSILWIFWSLIYGSQSEKKEKKIEERIRCWPFKWPLSHFGEGEGLQQGEQQQQWLATLSAPLWSEIVIVNESTCPWYSEYRVLCAHPVSCKLCVSCSRNRCTAAAMLLGVGIDSCLYAKNWDWLKLTVLYGLSLPPEVASLQYTPGFWNGLWESFCQCYSCLEGKTDSWVFLVFHLPRIFYAIHLQ